MTPKSRVILLIMNFSPILLRAEPSNLASSGEEADKAALGDNVRLSCLTALPNAFIQGNKLLNTSRLDLAMFCMLVSSKKTPRLASLYNSLSVDMCVCKYKAVRALLNLHPANMLLNTDVALDEQPDTWIILGAKCCMRASTNS